MTDFCKNGGTCYDDGTGSVACSCPVQFTGVHCDVDTCDVSVNFFTNYFLFENVNCFFSYLLVSSKLLILHDFTIEFLGPSNPSDETLHVQFVATTMYI